MTPQTKNDVIAVDVKCYYCGHISGQILGRKHGPLSLRNFRPRPGYQGAEVKPGRRLRCERCRGPVFLEDATHTLEPARRGARSASQAGVQPN